MPGPPVVKSPPVDPDTRGQFRPFQATILDCPIGLIGRIQEALERHRAHRCHHASLVDLCDYLPFNESELAFINNPKTHSDDVMEMILECEDFPFVVEKIIALSLSLIHI